MAALVEARVVTRVLLLALLDSRHDDVIRDTQGLPSPRSAQRSTDRPQKRDWIRDCHNSKLLGVRGAVLSISAPTLGWHSAQEQAL